MFFSALELATEAWKRKVQPEVDVVALLKTRIRDMDESDFEEQLPRESFAQPAKSKGNTAENRVSAAEKIHNYLKRQLPELQQDYKSRSRDDSLPLTEPLEICKPPVCTPSPDRDCPLSHSN